MQVLGELDEESVMVEERQNDLENHVESLQTLEKNYLEQKRIYNTPNFMGFSVGYTQQWIDIALELRIQAFNDFFVIFNAIETDQLKWDLIHQAEKLTVFSENRSKLPVFYTTPILKFQELKKWLDLPENDRKAVQVANECKAFIRSIRELDNPNAVVTKEMRYNYADLVGKIMHMLPIINNGSVMQIDDRLVPIHEEIENHYYVYLLQQVSQLNHYFNRVAFIADKRTQELNDATPPSTNRDTWNGLHKLLAAGIKGIEHPLLQQPTNLTIEVEINNKEQIFRNAYVEKDEGKIRRYYNKRDENTPKHAPHQDRAHYYVANKVIGTATQLSNVKNKCTPVTLGEGKDAYFKHADRMLHETEQALFRSAIQKVQTGQELENEEQNVLQNGKYYRFNSPVKYKPFTGANRNHEGKLNYQITHVGHAAEYIAIDEAVPLNICIDPVQYQTGTGGVVGIGGKIAYDRYTDPAFKTDGYPGVNVVLISHNHFDHLCEQTIKEAFANSNALFIVPVGDGQYMKAWGITNYIEMGSWNDTVTITVKDGKGNSSTYEIRAFPAKHASCRGLHDFYESLYMGFMVREVNKKEVILLTGDTAVLDDEHFEQLSNYLVDNELKIDAACIAHGPDRPRQWMECTHQSTADALTMHAKFNQMNARVSSTELRIPDDHFTFEMLKEAACYGIGYHQGCYRLGLLSLSDVDTTLLRTFAVLKSFGDSPINEITEETLSKNVFYCFMDPFEKKALLETLRVYQAITLDTGCLTANQTIKLITSHLHIPQPGYRADFSQNKPYTGFRFEYERLIQNRNPSIGEWNSSDAYAFEYYCKDLDHELYKGDAINKIALTSNVLNMYLARSKSKFNDNRRKPIEDFLNDITLSEDNLEERLGALYQLLFDPQDDKLREEGHSHTAITLIAGLLYFPEFREKIHACYNTLNAVIIFSEGDDNTDTVYTDKESNSINI